MPRGAGVSSSNKRTRKKVKLGHGFSQMDWIRLNSKAKDMNGLNGKPPSAAITRDELRRHRSQYDCWMVLRGKVYNVTKYIPYHPGGVDEIMRGAGIDGTKLFDKYHSYVSIDGFLEKCYVGEFVDDTDDDRESGENGAGIGQGNGESGESGEVVFEDNEKEDKGGEGEISWGDLDSLL